MARRNIDIQLDRAALENMARGPIMEQVLRVYGDQVRDRARANAVGISQRLADAIWTDEPDVDAEGAFVDVGYNKTRPGWVLWFHEVGTTKFPARPHLRPALIEG